MLRLSHFVLMLLVIAGCASPDLLAVGSDQQNIITSRILSETYAVAVGRFELSVQHPEGWFILHQYGDAIAMTNSQRLLDGGVQAFIPGELAVLVLYVPEILVEDFADPNATSTETALQLLHYMVIDDVEAEDDLEVIPMTVNDRAAVKIRTNIPASLYGTESADVMDSIAYAITQPEGYAILVSSGLAGDLIQYDSLLDDIAETVRVTQLGGG